MASHRSLSSEIRDDQSTYLSLHRPPEAVSAVEGTRLNPEHDKDTTNDPETVANSTEDTSTAYDSTACAFIDILNAHRSRKTVSYKNVSYTRTYLTSSARDHVKVSGSCARRMALHKVEPCGRFFVPNEEAHLHVFSLYLLI